MSTQRPFQKGDHVIYKNNGVCRIEDVSYLAFGSMPKREYYILRPLSEEGAIYVPTDGGIATPKLRKIPEKSEIDALIDNVEKSSLEWIENSKLRIVAFDRLLSSGNRESILWLVKVLNAKKEQDAAKGKRLCTNEERILSTAEKIITEEFAFALELDKKNVVPYILARIEKTKP